MAQIDDQIKQAVAAGYSPDEVKAALLQAGAKPEWAEKTVAPHRPVQPKDPNDNFMNNSGLSGILGALGGAGQGIAQAGRNAYQRLSTGELPPAPKSPETPLGSAPGEDLFKGIIGGIQGEASQASQAFQAMLDHGVSGEQASNFLRHTIGMTPGVGPNLANLLRPTNQQNVGGAAGDLLSAFGPQALEASGLGPAFGGALRKVGRESYRSLLPLPSGTPKFQTNAVLDTAMKEKLPIGGASSEASAAKLGDIKPGGGYTAGSYLDRIEKQITPYVTGSNGAIDISAKTVMGPFMKSLEQVMGAAGLSTSAGEKADTMLKEIAPMIKKNNPLIHDAMFLPDKNGNFMPPQTKAKMLQLWIDSDPDVGTVADAHGNKKLLYSQIDPKTYKNNPSAAPAPGVAEAKEQLARGYKQGVNEIHPDVGALTAKQSAGIALRNALELEYEKNPTRFLNTVAGMGAGAAGAGIAGAAASYGHPMAGGIGLAGILATDAITDPRIASRLALVFGKSSPELGMALNKVAKAGQGISLGLGLPHQSGKQPPQ